MLIWPDHDAAGQKYANRAAQAIANIDATSVSILQVAQNTSEKWDAFDAVAEGLDVNALIHNTEKQIVKENQLIPTYDLDDAFDNFTPVPDDLIAPRVLTPGGLTVFGGAPKVGKSDFLLSLLIHMAAGEPFLGFTPPRPLSIFYLQAELQGPYLLERIREMGLSKSIRTRAVKNILMTPQLDFTLDDSGVNRVIKTVKKRKKERGLDIFVVDPIRNVFDGGPYMQGENDNNAMLFFLQQRVIKIRNAINPDAGIILVHHTKKISKQQLEEDPFQALCGASSLRSYYTSGMILYRPDENLTNRHLVFELRNGKYIPTALVDKRDNQWFRQDLKNQRLIQKAYGRKRDAERERKHNTILKIICEEAAKGRMYIAKQFAAVFDGKQGLGGSRNIEKNLNIQMTRGHIKLLRDLEGYDLPALENHASGYLCVENMELLEEKQAGDEQATQSPVIVKPTHYKCPQTGSILPDETPDIWTYEEAETYV